MNCLFQFSVFRCQQMPSRIHFLKSKVIFRGVNRVLKNQINWSENLEIILKILTMNRRLNVVHRNSSGRCPYFFFLQSCNIGSIFLEGPELLFLPKNMSVLIKIKNAMPRMTACSSVISKSAFSNKVNQKVNFYGAAI